LEAHPDYSAVHGRSVIVTAEPRDGRRTLTCLSYWQRAVTATTAPRRLLDYLGHYSVLNYAVHRTEDLRRHVALCREHAFGFWWAELSLGSLAVIGGKVHCLRSLYLVKETHEGMGSRREGGTWQEGKTSLSIMEWMTDDAFAEKYRAFRDCLAGELAWREGMEVGRARDLVTDAFSAYLARTLTKKGREHRAAAREGIGVQLRHAARKVPGLRATWHAVRSLIPGGDRPASLAALLRPLSADRRDFVPIYLAMRGDADGVLAQAGT
jgi:hypothetical protein